MKISIMKKYIEIVSVLNLNYRTASAWEMSAKTEQAWWRHGPKFSVKSAQTTGVYGRTIDSVKAAYVGTEIKHVVYACVYSDFRS